MITQYVEKALERADYAQDENGSFVATVRGLRGVIAIGATVEECRRNLGEVIEEWVLVRVANGLEVPRLGRIALRVRRAG